MNSFPVSADAVDYSALNLQQYYFLTTSVLENRSRIVPKVQTSLRTYLQQSSEKERIKKLQKNMSTLEHRKFTDPEDIYCSLYAQLYACNDKFCEQLPQADDSVDELHRVASGFRSIEVIDALLIELKHNRDLPEAMIKNLRNTLFSSVNFSDSILGTVAVQRDVGLLLDGGLIHPNMPVVRQMLVRYFELLQKLIQAETLGMTVKLDPMLLDFLISGLQVLPPGVSSHSGSPALFAPQPMDPAKFYKFALNQTATLESLEAYLARHAASSAKISPLEKDYLKAPSTTPNASADAAYEKLIRAFLAASQEPGV
jgi:hypothetical protein